MSLVDSLKEFFEKSGGTQVCCSNVRWGLEGKGVVYVDLEHPDHGKGRIRCGIHRNMNDVKVTSITPMKRFFENYSPWDSTIKSVATLYSGISGVNGVANRSVNTSLI
jgi:hypothetical protein